IKGTDLRIMFIDDRPEIAIEANILHTEEYEVKGSPATTALKAFMEEQANLMEENRKKSAIIDSLKTRKFSLHITDSLQKEVNRDLVDFFQRYIKFADTISSPAAFLYIYNNVDFGRDYSGLKKFILHAAERFPSAPQVQKLKTETLEYLKAFGKQYNPGDQLPDVELPNVNGNIFSTSLLRGKYVFMDFWSTWCEDCLKYDAEKQRAKKEFSPDKFEIVSIALDAEKDTWKSYIEARKLDWPELIDEKMWEGPTARNLRVDSLPFNYLLAPDGKIIYKAVKPDSLLPILKKIIR
ncbi:MAG TPA: TlpA disulfide reductase family protein, partial [Chitinophagaceae bacterium]|nr:TlpA disulfide reductase family protein [Chitinophagaceae bacterium]